MSLAESALRVEPRPLALALIHGAPLPVLLLDTELRVLAASRAFLDAFITTHGTVDGRCLFDVDALTWDVPHFREMLLRVMSGALQEGRCELDFLSHDYDTRRIAARVRKIDCMEHLRAPLLVTITDVTKDRAGERQQLQLQRERAELVRQVQSQRDQLEKLCESIGVSIDTSQSELALHVVADASVSNPRLSAALGTIVTEMVMRALNAVDPNFSPGAVHLGYYPEGPGWSLRLLASIDELTLPDTDNSGFMVSVSVEANDALMRVS